MTSKTSKKLETTSFADLDAPNGGAAQQESVLNSLGNNSNLPPHHIGYQNPVGALASSAALGGRRRCGSDRGKRGTAWISRRQSWAKLQLCR